MCLATALPFIPGWWLADLFAHFRVQYALLLLVALLVSRRYRARVVVLGVAFALNALSILPLFAGPPRAPPTTEDTIILAANLLSDNDDFGAVLALVSAEDPDVIALLEYSPRWQHDLASLAEEYPYILEDPRSDNFGIALFSRLPFDGQIIEYGDGGLPSIDLLLSDGLRVIATHPVPPTGAAGADRRDTQLAALAEVAAQSERVLIVGDFNATPFSRPFRELLRQGDLRTSSRSWDPTWPAEFPPLWIALDHALVGAGVDVVEFRIGSAIGSDHSPIIVRVR